MRHLHKVAARGLVASLTAALLVTGFAGTVLGAASATPVTTTVVANGTATSMPVATVTIGAPADIAPGTLTLTLPAGFSWAATGTIATVETGGLAVTDGAVTLGGTTASFTVSGAAIAGTTISFSSPTVKTMTKGAKGDVVLSGIASPTSLVVAKLKTPGHDNNENGQNDDNQGGRDADHGNGHGARKVGFFDNPAYTCATGAQPAAGVKTFGFAILNTTGKRTLNVNVVLKGALPNAAYDVWVNQHPGACPLGAATKVGAVHTDALGNGAGHLKMSVVSGAKHFWLSATSGASVLRTRAAMLTIKGK
jgi:hypothetical protein